MNKLRKLVALLLIPALALALAGCGFAGKMALAARKMQKLQSYRMDMDVDMDLQLSLLGKSMDMGMEISGSSDVNTKPARTRSDMRVEMFGQGLTVLSYTETTDGSRTTYSSMNDGKTWTKKTQESGEGAAGRTDFAALLKLASAFEKTGTETVRGEEATVYSGVISAADLDGASDLSGLLGSAFSAMDLPTDGLNPAEYGSIPTTIAIGNKSGMIVRYTMDLTEFMGNMMPEMMKAALADASEKTGLGSFDLGTLGFSVETGRVFATTELYDFDAVGTIEIPAEALDAPEAAD